jgi:hypothetical protein
VWSTPETGHSASGQRALAAHSWDTQRSQRQPRLDTRVRRQAHTQRQSNKVVSGSYPYSGLPILRRLDAIQPVARTGERWFAAELNRHKGQLLLRQGDSEAAANLYREALGTARQQGARLWELRARRHCEQGRHTEAGDLLAPI